MTREHDVLFSFFQHFPAIEFEPGEALIHKGARVEHIYYLRQGVVKQHVLNQNGKEISVNLYKEGSFIPLIWGLERRESPYDFIAVTKVIGYKAPTEEVSTFLQTNNEACFALCLRLLRGLEGMSRKVEHAMYHGATVRVVDALITLGDRFGMVSKGKEVEITLPVTHQQLAELTGLSREAVTRELQKLKSQGIVKKQGSSFVLTDIDKLRHLL